MTDKAPSGAKILTVPFPFPHLAVINIGETNILKNKNKNSRKEIAFISLIYMYIERERGGRGGGLTYF